MDKKKLQLSEIKVKSLVTLVDQQEQRTAKGGFYYNNNAGIAINVSDTGNWTEYKTRVAVNNETTILSFNGGGSSSTKS